jgi:hypothetical protein
VWKGWHLLGAKEMCEILLALEKRKKDKKTLLLWPLQNLRCNDTKNCISHFYSRENIMKGKVSLPTP